MPEPTDPPAGVLEPWATVADVCAPCNTYEFDQALLGDMLDVASDLLFQLSGRQFPGHGTATIRPWSPCRCNGWSPFLWAGGIFASQTLYGPEGYQAWRARGGCDCTPWQTDLGLFPVLAVTEVKVDGSVVDPGDGVSTGYRVDDWRTLVRLPDPATGLRGVWPCCPIIDLPDTARGTFSVTATYGRRPPAGGVAAAAFLACQLALACTPGAAGCQLPQRVTSVVRQNVSMIVLDPMAFLEDGKTGLYSVDLWLKSVNPGKLSRPPAVLSPDNRRFRRPGTS